jgi:SAM-dependent methyltransferase
MQDKSESGDSLENYRASHASTGYGEHYSRTYQVGYYAELWRHIERPLLERILRELSERGAASCLDFACGTGRITQVNERFFEHAVGIDVSEQMLAVAKKACVRAELVQRDITAEPLDRKFDVITAFRFFLNAEPKLRDQVLASLAKAMEDSGTLIVNVHVNHSSPLGFAYRIRNAIRGKTVANTLSVQHLESLLNDHGFAVKRIHWYGFYPRTGWMFNSLANLLQLPVERVFAAVKILPRRWAQSFIVEAQRSRQTKA